MKVSIIIVSYNEKKYLSDAIDSCLNQSGDFDFELIIGDDGSTDGSIELIKEYQEKNPDLIKSFVMDRDNETDIIASIRVSNVLKKGFGLSTGEYLCVLSGDDILIDNEKIKKQIEFLDIHPKYKSCYSDYQEFWDNGETKLCCDKRIGNSQIFWASKYMHVSTFVFKRECLIHLLDRLCDDEGLIFSILKTGKTKHLDFVGMGYRQREKSLMKETAKLEFFICEMIKMQDVLNEGGLYTASLSRFYYPLKMIIKNRKELSSSEYKKYFDSCAQYSNNILNDIASDNNKRKIKNMYYMSYWYKNYYKVLFLLGTALYHIAKK